MTSLELCGEGHKEMDAKRMTDNTPEDDQVHSVLVRIVVFIKSCPNNAGQVIQ